MPKPKFDRVELDKMLRDGIPQKDIAKRLGVSSGAITQAKKQLNIAVVKNASLEAAHLVVHKHLDTISQLQKINANANELLDLLMRWGRGDEEALQILESQVKKVRVKGTEEEVTEYKFKDPRELALKAMAEIRGQLNLQLDIFKVLFDAEAVSSFQSEVLQAIGEVDHGTKDAIIERLKKRRAVRSAFTFS